MRIARFGNSCDHAIGVGGNGANGEIELGEGEAQRHRREGIDWGR
jgi:hypothetical protein